MTRIGIIGSAGRMGAALAAAIEAAGCAHAGGIDRDDGAAQLAALAAGSDVLVDFSSPAALEATLDAAVAADIPAVIGTTGLEERHHWLIDAAAEKIAVLQTGNTSLGVTMLAALVREAAARLGPDWDIEIVEMHHRHKVDAPSGTALQMGEVLARAVGRSLDECAVYAREGVTGERDPSTIGFSSIRGGDIVGDHTVLFAGTGERIEITHKSASRVSYAQGSLRAARFLAGRSSGLFDMNAVLGLG